MPDYMNGIMHSHAPHRNKKKIYMIFGIEALDKGHCILTMP